MCDPTITPEVSGVDKLPANAKLFLTGKNRPLFVTDEPKVVADAVADAKAAGTAFEVTNLNGEVGYFAPGQFVSVVAVTPSDRRKVDVSQTDMRGHGIKARGYTADDEAELGLGVTVGEAGEYVVVEGEDLAAMVLVVVRRDGTVIYEQDQEPERNLRRARKIALFALEMVAVNDAEAEAAAATTSAITQAE